VRNLGRLGFTKTTLRLSASLVLVLLSSLATGGFELGDEGCSTGDRAHGALSHEHARADHDPREADHEAGQASNEHEDEHGDDCPPFCGDCQDCAGCFHPLATDLPVLALELIGFSLGRPDHLLPRTAQPPRWAPSPPLHVPRTAHA
jgi:hypothetical protein